MQEFLITELIPHPRNNEFFDDIEGEKWTEFLASVKSRGVIEPIVITPNKVIVSGHQRVRACKELGIEKVWCDIHTYNNDDQILQDLLETNLKQRGEIGGSAKKVGLRIRELERIYGVRNGSAGKVSLDSIKSSPKTQADIANDMGIGNKDTYLQYKKLADMIPELSDLVDTGIVTKTTALAIMKTLSVEEQEELIASLDTTQKITQKQMEQYISQLQEKDNQIAGYELKLQKVKQLESEISELKTKLAEKPTEVVVEKAVVPDDYERAKEMAKNLQTDYDNTRAELFQKVSELNGLKRDIEQEKNSTPERKMEETLKDDTIFFCSKVDRFIKEVGGLAYLSDKLDSLPAMEKKSYIKAVSLVKAWADNILENISE